jgi:hypothetical protein
MISGPSGTGKTYSALRLARGMAGPDGKICFADTDNSRARLYAAAFQFDHLDLHEPYRPMLFEQAAIAAQKQKAAVLVIDNFAAEWVGLGGILEWHEEELTKLTKGDISKRDQLNMIAWARVKPAHKHMFQRLYQLNMPIILCCAAEKKIAMVKQTEGKDKGKVIPVDQGFQPIGDKDAAYAMTASLLLPDVHAPGVPVAIKALLPDLRPIIHLDRPLDEATGAAIAAWAKGEPVAAVTTGSNVGGEETEPPPSPPPPESDQRQDDEIPPPESDQREATPSPPPTDRRQVDEASIEQGAKDLAVKFLGVEDRKAYFALVDDKAIRKQIEWLKRNRRPLFNSALDWAMKAAWQRTDPNPRKPEQGDLMNDKTDRAAGDPGGR